MKYARIAFRIFRGVVKTLRLSLPKLGVGWMFALLTINFNRITIVELSVPAVAVSAMLALHYFLSPFQVISGRIADRHPIMGLRRTPYLLTAAVVSSLLFLALPSVAEGMGTGAINSYIIGFGILIIYGISIAVMGDSHHALIAEVVESKDRSTVISVVWTLSILSTIIAAGVMISMMPEYSPAAMQRLYNLTPFIVIGSVLLGIVGMEKRLNDEEIKIAIEKAEHVAPVGNPIKAAVSVLRENKQAAGFFAFVFISIFSIFLQDNILEPFGAEVFGMSVAETTSFQPAWGGGVLIGMLIIGVLAGIFNINKRLIAIVGCVGTAVGYGILSAAALTETVAWVKPSLMFMGFFTGFFNVGALSMMMDMTVEGATGLYMGLWGMAQAFGNGASSFAGGALHTAFIGTGFLTPESAYFMIFGIEAIGMVAAGILVYNLSVSRFQNLVEQGQTRRKKGLSLDDAVLAMETNMGG
ncbi:MAG: BCD family MFS transporter [Anaerolineae bacterium]